MTNFFCAIVSVVVVVVYYIFKILSTNAFVMIKKEACNYVKFSELLSVVKQLIGLS